MSRTRHNSAWYIGPVGLGCLLALGAWSHAAEPIVDAEPSDPVAGRDHWAFQPLASPPPPAVQAADWPREPLDAFILARLESAGLAPAPDTDRRRLARRLYLQLIGLAPTAAQIDAFVEDARPDAVERLVDQLLASPRFGEHWGRHWLDLARYADSNGLDENFLFREAWRYRNWVIAAMNEDLPFDRFVLEQLAGDLLPFDSLAQRDRQRIAAGFLVVGPKVLLGNDERKQRMEVADEQLDTIGKALLGQTLGCARCHDHKFDPIPTADYYALAGILTSTQVVEQRFMLGEQRVMERLVGLGEAGDQADEAYEAYWRQRPQVTQRQQRAKSALEALERGDMAAVDKLLQEHSDAVAPEAADAGREAPARIESQRALLAELDRVLAQPPAIPPRAMIPGDLAEPHDERIREAGQFDRPGDLAPRGFLRVVGDATPAIPANASGRVELGRWLTDTEQGAGRLAARVLANRVWHHLVGRGLVGTLDNFGRTGDTPSHPELLDHLAGELIRSGWSVKQLVRTIAISRTFAMSSRHDDAAYELDPENRLLWRAQRRRLPPESLRDSMLQAAGALDLTPLDSTVWYLGDQATAVGDNKVRRRTDFPCRSVYLPVIRNDLPELFQVFDFADPHATTGMRPQTTVATQGLYLLNDESVMVAADAVARRVLLVGADNGADADVEKRAGARVDTLYRLVVGELPGGEERAEVRTFVAELERRFAAEGRSTPEQDAWSLACHALLVSSRFQFTE